MIVSSFQTQYGIRLSQDLKGMSWREFSYLLSGLDAKTPLGRVVSIRAEDDPEMLKGFSREQHKIRNEYRRKIAKAKPQAEVNNALEDIKQAFIRLAGGVHEET